MSITFAMSLCLDSARGGVNDILAAKIGLVNVFPMIGSDGESAMVRIGDFSTELSSKEMETIVNKVQDTIQNFIRKYRSLVDRVHVDDSFNTDVKFNIRSFQRTLIDFYFALDKEYDKVLIKVNNTNKHQGKPQIKPQGRRQSQ